MKGRFAITGLRQASPRFWPVSLALAIGLALFSAVERSSAALASHDLAKDFSHSSNPSGVWRYGYSSALDGSFTLFTFAGTGPSDNGLTINHWAKGSGTPPAIFKNTNNATAYSDGGDGMLPPQTVWFMAGADGTSDNYGIIRLTVPAGGTGTYDLKAIVQTTLNGESAADGDFHVLRNGQLIYSKSLAPLEGITFAKVLALTAGDTLDFATGRGPDGTLFGSGLKVDIRLNQISNYDVSREFSTIANPNGPWSYGYKATLSGPLTLLTFVGESPSEDGVPLVFRSKNSFEPPAVYFNPNTNETAHSDGNAGTFPPGQVWFGAGHQIYTNETFGIIRFTVPAGEGGTYHVKAMVESFLNGSISGDNDFHVVKNGVEFFSKNLDPNDGTFYQATFSLAAGDVLEFAAGRGPDGDIYASSLKIRANIRKL